MAAAARARLEASRKRAEGRGKIASADEVLARLRGVDEIGTSSDGILASNTLSIPILKLEVATNRSTHVVGVHFFNPAPVPHTAELAVAADRPEHDRAGPTRSCRTPQQAGHRPPDRRRLRRRAADPVDRLRDSECSSPVSMPPRPGHESLRHLTVMPQAVYQDRRPRLGNPSSATQAANESDACVKRADQAPRAEVRGLPPRGSLPLPGTTAGKDDVPASPRAGR